RRRDAGFRGVAQYEFASLDRRALSGEWIKTAAFDEGLIDAVLISERIAIVRLSAEILHRNHHNAGKALVLRPRHIKHAVQHADTIAEDAEADVRLVFAVDCLPILGRVLALVAKLERARGHALTKRFREALERRLGNAERFKARIAYSDRKP